MSQQDFYKTFGPVTVEWCFVRENTAFDVKISLIGIGRLYSGLLHSGNSQVPFSFGKTAGADDILKGKLKFRTDTSGRPSLIIDLKCDAYNINESNYLLSSQDSNFTSDILEETQTEKPINFTEIVEMSAPEKPVNLLEIVEKSETIEPTVDAIALTPETVFANKEEYQDLFPFVYMRIWPEISPDLRQRRFVEYDLKKVPQAIQDGSLYINLLEIKKDQSGKIDPRTEMENEARHFINGDSATRTAGKSYADQFIQNISNLKGYIKYFARLNTWLRQQQYINLPTLKSRIEKFLGLKCWSAIEEYIKGKNYHLPELIGENITENTEGAITEYMKEKNRVWQNFFALTIFPEYRPHLLEELTKTLVMCNLMERLVATDDENCCIGRKHDADLDTSEEILEAAKATIILPKDIFPLPPASKGESPSESKPTGWIEPYAIGDLQLVRQRLLRYELGEIAHIENVLKGERKETTQRKLNRVNESVTNASEQLEETETEIEGTRADLLTETRKTLVKDTITTTFNDFKATYGSPTTVTYTGSWSIKNAPENPYIENVTNFAKKITTRTANRIARYVSQVRTFSALNEAEEIVIHAFDNTAITSNVIGIYRWVNKIYKVHVVNYGHRLMIQFLLPNPAHSYITNLFQLKGISLEPPITPDKLNLKSYADVTRANYPQLATIYDIQPPPIEVKIIPAAFKDGEPINLKKISIPEGYRANSACVAGVFSGIDQLTGFVGKKTFSLTASSSKIDSLEMNQEDSAIAVSVMCNTEQPDKKYCVTIEVKCTLTPEKYEEWQIKTYNAIQEGYRQQKAEYYERAGVGKTEIGSHNPLENRKIENNELKKGCTKQLLQQHLQLVGASEDNAFTKCGVSRIAQLKYIQFFEQAFEWDEMTYQLSPSFQEQVSPEEFTTTALNYYSLTDSIFTNFLQAESARVLLPVRHNYTMLVLYYLSSGMMWSGENSLTPTNEKYVSIVNELKTLPELDCECKYVSKPWEITIPTSMIMLQDSSKLPQFPVVL
ncbi:MAG TPA: hypothetical protein DCY88_02985 [Cyanobacteria bacterium UBA11372]|nr:hypothetical protein [Cyanobacteria bacterium UBA11372]